jgi:tetratricopeptide (TPR) repeat protein
MKPYRSRSWIAVTYCVALIFQLVTIISPGIASKRNTAPKPATPSVYLRAANDPLTRTAMEHFYNMEYDKAIQKFEQVVVQHPEDPFAVNHLASSIMWRELYRIGALDTELYAKDAFIDSRENPPDPKVRAKLKELFDRAQVLAEKRLQANPNDTDALFAHGITRGMRSTYTGMVDKAWFSALRSAVGARHDHERVLELDPSYTDAKFIVGVHNYVSGSVPWAVKVAASVIGLSGNRKKGIQYLYEASNAGGETSVDAKIALSLFLRREQRYKEAIELVGGLMQRYPRNYLAALEHANLLNAAGHGPEAIAAYRKLLEVGKNGRFPDARLEQAAWGLGEALRGQRDFSGAAQVYESIPGFKNVNPELQDRSNLAAGEMYDLMNQRDAAVKKYQAVVAAAGNSPRADLAKKRLKKPYQMPKS